MAATPYQVLLAQLACLLLLPTARGDSEPPSPALLPNGYLEQRLALVEQERAAQQAQQDRAAQVASQLAAQPAWSPPDQQPSSQPSGSKPQEYVDLSAAPSSSSSGGASGSLGTAGLTTQAANGRLTFASTSARHPRMPAAAVPPRPRMLIACPNENSVKRFGALGDGSTDDTGSIARAASKLAVLYFPPGTYRISRNLRITKPISFGVGAVLRIEAGAMLTFTQRLQHWDVSNGLFAGPGRVALKGSVDYVRPEWFRRPGEGDSEMLQRAADACAAGCTLMLSRYYGLSKPVYLNERVGVFSTGGALIKSEGGNGGAFVLTAGTYRRTLRFATIWGFRNFGIKIQGGVSGAEIQLGGGMLDCGDGFLFATNEGPQRTIANVFVTHFTSTSAVQNTVVFRGSGGQGRVVNSVVRGNFIVAPGFSNPTAQSAALAIKGSPPALEGTEVVFQAVEATQFSRQTQFVMLQNTARRPANNVVLRVEAWGGGLGGSGKVLDGKFTRLRLLLRMSGGIPSAANFMAGIGGSSNWVSNYGVGSAGAETVMPTAPNPEAFGGGRTSVDQVLYLNAPVTGTWAPGEARTFYLFNAYAATAGSRFWAIPFRAGNAGLVVEKVENQHAEAPGQIALTLRNAAAYPVPSWMTAHRFGFQVGP